MTKLICIDCKIETIMKQKYEGEFAITCECPVCGLRISVRKDWTHPSKLETPYANHNWTPLTDKEIKIMNSGRFKEKVVFT